MPVFEAFIFDMNGTMVNDMHYHEQAWHHILVHELHTNLSREQVKQQMYGKNEELFDRIFGAGTYTPEQVADIAERKEAQYRKDFLPHLQLIDGLHELLKKAEANNVVMAIGTAANKPNVDFVLDNLHIRHYFNAIVTADDVEMSKPHPEVFLKAAERLGVGPASCLVFEDSPKGIEAAKRAGMKAVGITTYHTAEELCNDNVICIINDYMDTVLDRLIW